MITRPGLIGFTLVLVSISSVGSAQHWRQNDAIFNPSGIPSLSFSQPRFADLDADNDFDLILGSISEAPHYFQNTGSATAPAFEAGADIFAVVDPLDAEVGVCIDLDADGDLDLICGGFRGLNLYANIGDATAPEFQRVEGFFAGLAVGSIPVPSLADLDADADHDLVVGMSEDGSVKYYPNIGTPQVAAYAEAQAETWFDVGLYAFPWFSDLDNDNDLDLLVGRDGPGFHYYRNIGDPTTWQWQAEHAVFSGLAGSSFWNSPCLVDLTGDGKQDLVYGTDAGPLQYFVNTGSHAVPIWTVNTDLFGGVLDVGGASSPFLFDFDSDDDLDLVSGSQLGDIKYFENVGTSTAPAWQADHAPFASIDHSIYSAITLGDVDADTLPDAIVGDLSGNFFFHRNTGTGFIYDASVFQGVNLGGWSAPRLLDMDDDLDLDIVAGNEWGQLFYFENIGQANSPDWVEVGGFFGGIDVGNNSSPTLGDYDDDGDMDLFVGNLSHAVRFFENVDGNWVEDPAVVTDITAGQNAAPAVADLDADGDLDLTIGNYGGTFNYFENTSTTSISREQATPQPGRQLLSAQPNPFNPTTLIRYDLPQRSDMALTIFDVAGRVVRHLVDENQPAGQYATHWHGADDSGRAVTAGVYLCRLEARGLSRTIKLVCLK